VCKKLQKNTKNKEIICLVTCKLLVSEKRKISIFKELYNKKSMLGRKKKKRENIFKKKNIWVKTGSIFNPFL